MDVVYAVKKYVTEMIDQTGPGMKVLLMDDETVSSLFFLFFFLLLLFVVVVIEQLVNK